MYKAILKGMAFFYLYFFYLVPGLSSSGPALHCQSGLVLDFLPCYEYYGLYCHQAMKVSAELAYVYFYQVPYIISC